MIPTTAPFAVQKQTSNKKLPKSCTEIFQQFWAKSGPKLSYKAVYEWSEGQVQQWLREVGMGEWMLNFSDHNINGAVMFDLTHDLLMEMEVDRVGDRMRLLLLLQLFRKKLDDPNSTLNPPKLKKASRLSPQLTISTSRSQEESDGSPNTALEEDMTIFKKSPRPSGSENPSFVPTPMSSLSPYTNPSSLKASPTDISKQQKFPPSISAAVASIQQQIPHAQLIDGKNKKQPGSITSSVSEMSRSGSNLELNVSKRVIRVFGDEGQSRMVDVTDIKTPRQLYAKVFQKFGLWREKDPNSSSALDKEIDTWYFTTTDKNDFRALKDDELLRYASGSQMRLDTAGKSSTPQIQMRRKNEDASDKSTRQKASKLAKFFGENILAQSTSMPTSPVTRGPTNVGQRPNTPGSITNSHVASFISNKKLTTFFGERPPSEMITTNLTKFFPTVKNSASNMNNPVSIQAGLQSPTSSTRSFQRSQNLESPLTPTSRTPVALSTANSSSSLSSQRNASDSDIFKPPTIPASSQQILPQQPLPPSAHGTLTSNASTTLSSSSQQRKIKWTQGKKIGQGSFGGVFYGLNVQTGELMAVKQVELPQEPIPSDSQSSVGVGMGAGKKGTGSTRKMQMVESIQREIHLLKDLQHPNIVRYLGMELGQTHFNIFLEYVPGGSLAKGLASFGPFQETLIVSFVKQILSGLAYLHEKNIVHRDIKSGNILVDQRGIVKITDFGISKKIVPPNGRGSVVSVIAGVNMGVPNPRNRQSALAGSVYWLAPEVVKHHLYSKRSDIWSLGCVVIEMYTADHPWAGLNQMAAILKIGNGEVPPYPENVCKEAKDFLDRCLDPNVKQRPYAEELATHPYLALSPAPLDDEDDTSGNNPPMFGASSDMF